MNRAASTVLLTGAGGRLARLVRPRLAALCRELRLSDRVPFEAPGMPDHRCHVGELADIGQAPALLDGVDAIVHFAGFPREADWPTLLQANVIGAIRLWEAARAHGVRRIVYASSNHAVGFYARDVRIDHRVPPRPDTGYGLSKVFMEGLASLYADKHGLRGLGLRIGHCAPEPSDHRMLSNWIHPDDLVQLIEIGLQADYHHGLVYGVSANSASFYDNRLAHALGYRPRHSADAWRERLGALRSDDPVAERYQGGSFAANGYDGDPERAARAG